MDEIQIKTVINLVKKYTYEEAREDFLNKLEFEMESIVSLNNNYQYVELFAKFLYGRKKYAKAIEKFNSIKNIDECRARVNYALFKCFVMVGNYSEAYKCINNYIMERKNENIVLGMGIILSSFDIIFNNTYTKIEVTDLFLMNKIKDSELQKKYAELVENFNKKNFSRCIDLANECDKICKFKKIMIEFETFSMLLIKLKEISSPDLYQELKEAKAEHNFERIIEIIKELPTIEIKNERLFYSSLYLLIKNGYSKEVENILSNTYFSKENKVIVSTLKKAIVEQREYEKLSEVQKENYYTALKLGNKYYRNYEVETAYDVYTFGEYTTGLCIFKYYIGKMFFKAGQERLAKKYFEEYIKVGAEKLGKAYLYLATIYKNMHDNKTALYYSKLVEMLNKMYDTDYEMYYIYDKNNKEEDPVKMRLQGKKKMYNVFFKENSEKN